VVDGDGEVMTKSDDGNVEKKDIFGDVGGEIADKKEEDGAVPPTGETEEPGETSETPTPPQPAKKVPPPAVHEGWRCDSCSV